MASFLGIVENLLRDSGERVAYFDDPTRFLGSHGFGDFDSSTVATGLFAVAESLPPRLAQYIDPQAGLESVVAVDLATVVGLWAPSDSSVDEVIRSGPVETAETVEAPVPEEAEERDETGGVDTSIEALGEMDSEQAGDPPWELEEFGE